MEWFEWLLYLPLFGFSFTSNDSDSTQTSQSQTDSRTGLFKKQAKKLSQFIGPEVSELINQFGSRFAQPVNTPQTGQSGLFSKTEAGVQSLAQDALSRLGSNANAGTLTQSSLAAALPGLAEPLAQAQQFSRDLPEDVTQQRFADTLGLVQQIVGLLGGSSTSSSTGAGSFNRSASGAGFVFGGGGGSAGQGGAA